MIRGLFGVLVYGLALAAAACTITYDGALSQCVDGQDWVTAHLCVSGGNAPYTWTGVTVADGVYTGDCVDVKVRWNDCRAVYAEPEVTFLDINGTSSKCEASFLMDRSLASDDATTPFTVANLANVHISDVLDKPDTSAQISALESEAANYLIGLGGRTCRSVSPPVAEVHVDSVRVGASVVDTETYTIKTSCASNAFTKVVTREVWVNDGAAPIFTNIPADVTADCHLVPRPCEPVAYDDVDGEVIVSFSETRQDGTCSNSYKLIRHWSAEDSAGNTVDKYQTVTVEDNEGPTLLDFDRPLSMSMSCDSVTSAVALNWRDNCDAEVASDVLETTNGVRIIRTFTGRDSCGHANTEVQTITVTDNVAPVIHGVPVGNITQQCHRALPTPCEVRVTDNCDDNVDYQFTEVTTGGSCPNEYELVQTWTATDSAGLSATKQRTINVIDTEAPEIVGVAGHLSLSCAQFVPTAQVSAYDNCDESVSVTTTPTDVGASCANSFTKIIDYSAADSCGNIATAATTIEVSDTEAPQLIGTPALAAMTVECDLFATAETVKAYDNCACADKVDVDVDFTETVAPVCNGAALVTRVWTATDCCGNSESFTQVITVEDNTPPVITGVSADLHRECDDPLAAAADLSVTDACDWTIAATVSATKTNTSIASCPSSYTDTYLYSISDDCGNPATETFDVIYTDSEAPLFTVPGAITVDCSASAPTDVAATDNCDATVTTATASSAGADNSCGNTQVNSWTVSDACGNTNTQHQTVTIQDIGVPTIDCSSIVHPVELGDVDWANMLSAGSWPAKTTADNCDGAGIATATLISQSGPACGEDFIVEYTYTDSCGNEATSCQHTYQVRDTTPPVFDASFPDDATVSCYSDINALVESDYLLTARTAAVGNSVTVDYTELLLSDSCVNQKEYEITFTARDACANTHQQAMTITFVDNVDPVWDSSTVFYEDSCDNSELAQMQTVKETATDNCDTGLEVVGVESAGTCTGDRCLSAYEFKYTIADACGNTIEKTVQYEIYDRSPPVITSCPADRSEDCVTPFSDSESLENVAFTDNCAATRSVIEGTTGSACDGTATRTYTVTDEAGNSDSCQLVVTNLDNAPPVCTTPAATTTVECTGSDSSAWFDPLVATDCTALCSAVTDNFNSVTVDLSADPTVVAAKEFSWTPTDGCGNTVNFATTVVVLDTTAPGFDVAAIGAFDTTLQCAPVAPGPVSATDANNCAFEGRSSTVDYNDAENSIDVCTATFPITYVREWTVTDAAGHTDTTDQTVTVEGDYNIAFSPTWTSDSIEFGATMPTWETVNAVSQCSTVAPTCDPDIVVAAPGLPVCDNNKLHTRTCTANNCQTGDVSYTQSITVSDTTPVSFSVPDKAMTCDEFAVAASSEEASVCTSLVGTYAEIVDCVCAFQTRSVATGGCFTVDLQCTVKDACDNSAQQTATYTVTDSTDPIVYPPAALSLDCAAAAPTDAATGYDSCGEYTISEGTPTYSSGAGAKTSVQRVMTRSFTATDQCGNSATDTQDITFTDDTNPSVCQSGGANTVEFGNYDSSTSWPAGVEVPTVADTTPRTVACTCAAGAIIDDCDTLPALTCTVQRVSDGCSHDWTDIVVYTSTDAAGNTDSSSFTLTVRDTTPPTILNPADFADFTVQVDSIEGPNTVSAEDTYDATATVTIPSSPVESSTYDNNVDVFTAFEIIRSWTVSDECNNDAVVTQTVSVIDTVVPEGVPVPADTTIACDASVDVLADIDSVVNHWADDGVQVTSSEAGTVTGDACATSGKVMMSIIRTYTATDWAGLTNTSTYTITLTDNTAPTFNIAVDPERTVEGCTVADGADTLSVTVSDNCGTAASQTAFDGAQFSVSTSSAASYSDSDNFSAGCASHDITRVWSATDPCGNSHSMQQIVHVVDTTAPEFTEIINDLTDQDCSADGTVTRQWTDNCDATPQTATGVSQNIGSACTTKSNYVTTWNIQDACGNPNSATQTVTYADNTKPTLDTPVVDETIDACDVNFAINGDVPTFSDACSLFTVTVQDSGECTWDQDVVHGDKCFREWTATDNCGNFETFQKTITFVDSNAPTFTIDDDVTVDCKATVPVLTATFDDDCHVSHLAVTPTNNTIDQTCAGDAYQVVYTWFVSDSNDAHDQTYSRTVTVTDDGAPVLDAPNDETVNTCAAPVSRGIPVSDCTDSTTAPQTIVPDNAEFLHINTWTHSDSCGTASTEVQTVTSVDIEIPVITCTGCDDRSWDCADPDNVPACSCSVADNWDNCFGQTTIVAALEEVDVTGACAGSNLRIRTYTATDAYGNNATAVVQTISFIDLSAPVLDTLPAHITVDCSAEAPANITATDSCDASPEVKLTTVKELLTDNAYPYLLLHTYEAGDACGNLATYTQTVRVEDTVPPTLHDVGVDVTLNCDAGPFTVPTVTGSDNCDDNMVGVVMTPTILSASCPEVTEYSWTATDKSGLTTVDDMTVIITDTAGVSVTGVTDQSFTNECVKLDAATGADCSDDCGTCTLTPNLHVITTAATGACSAYSYTDSWVATDSCGNTDTVTHSVDVLDSNPPVLGCAGGDCGATSVAKCGANPTAPAVEANDACDGIVATVTALPVRNEGDECGTGNVYIYDFEALDACGQKGTFSHSITVTDLAGPTWVSEPADVAIDCTAAATYVWPDHDTNDCHYGQNTPTQASLTLGAATYPIAGCTASFSVVGTYTGTDDCGKTLSKDVTLTVSDDNAPTAVIDETTITAECDNIPTAQTAIWTDDCVFDVSASESYDEIQIDTICTHSYGLERTWTATDGCGNTNGYTRTVEVRDTTAPDISIATDAADCVAQQVECSDPLPVCSPVLSDNCDSSIVFQSNGLDVSNFLDASNNDQYDWVQTWTAVDACGTNSTLEFTIAVRDTTPPTITIIADADAEYGAVPNPYDAQATADDNCDLTTVTRAQVSEQIPTECIYNTYDIRTSTATDSSGNTNFAVQTITVRDTTPPVIHNVPADVTIEFGSVPTLEESADRIDTRDSSGSAVTVTTTETTVTHADSSYTLTRCYTAVDACANSATECWDVLVQDTTPPTFNQLPAHKEVMCDAVPTPCVLETVGEDLTVTYAQVDASPYLIRTWDTQDASGNTASHTQTLTVIDSVAPVLSRTPGHEVVSCSCDTFPQAAVVVALDNCEESIDVTFKETKIASADAGSLDEYLLLRTWRASDGVNQVEHTQSITVEDNTPPVLYPQPASDTVQCNAVPAVTVVKAIDNCDETAEAVHSNVTTPSGVCDSSYTTVHTWSTTDRAGNTASFAQTVVVEDTTDPEIYASGSHCVAPPDSAKSAEFSFADLFTTNDGCGSVAVSFLSCNATSADANDCVINSGSDGVIVTAHAGYNYQVWVTASDECGNAVTEKASIAVPNDAAEMAALGLSDCVTPL